MRIQFKKLSICFILSGFLILNQSIAQNIGIGTSSPHASAALEIKDSTKGILIPRMTMVQRNAIANPAEGLMVYQTDSTKGFWFYQSNKWNRINHSDQSKSHYLGEYFGGGIIFHLNNDSSGVGHGLIVSIKNLTNASGVIWGCEDSTLNNISKWNGQLNTLETVRGCGLNTAAGVCTNYRAGGFTDWFLPSVEEWKLLFQNSYEIEKSLSNIYSADAIIDNNFPNEYWTSTGLKNISTTQFPDGTSVITPINSEALSFYMPYNGAAFANITPRSTSYPVRAIRRF